MTEPYFEIHLIVRHAGPRAAEFLTIAQRHAGWTSQIASNESLEEIAGDVIVTSRRCDKHDAYQFINSIQEDCAAASFQVIRSKIEHVIHDMRYA